MMGVAGTKQIKSVGDDAKPLVDQGRSSLPSRGKRRQNQKAATMHSAPFSRNVAGAPNLDASAPAASPIGAIPRNAIV